jgi:hypothetical protein
MKRNYDLGRAPPSLPCARCLASSTTICLRRTADPHYCEGHPTSSRSNSGSLKSSTKGHRPYKSLMDAMAISRSNDPLTARTSSIVLICGLSAHHTHHSAWRSVVYLSRIYPARNSGEQKIRQVGRKNEQHPENARNPLSVRGVKRGKTLWIVLCRAFWSFS